LFAPSPTCFRGLEFVERIRYENLNFRGDHHQEFKPTNPHSMIVQLLMRPLRRNDEFFREDKPRFRALLGYFESTEGERQAFTILLVRTGLGQYQRVFRSLNRGCDLEVINLDEHDIVDPSKGWSMRDVIISSPRPHLPPKSHVDRFYVPIALNCATALKAGVEVGGFWCEKGKDVKVEDGSGGKIYTAVLQLVDLGALYKPSVAFTVRHVKSGEICAFVLMVRDWDTFDVSVVYGLEEKDFNDRDFFTQLIERNEYLESQDLSGSVLVYKLKNGSHLFLSCDDQEILCGRGPREIGQLKLADAAPKGVVHGELPEVHGQWTKAQLRVGMIE
jgi:hypothetical protein